MRGIMNSKQVFSLLLVVNVLLFLTYIALQRFPTTTNVVHMEPNVSIKAASTAEKHEIITNTDVRDKVPSSYKEITKQLGQTTVSEPKKTLTASTVEKHEIITNTDVRDKVPSSYKEITKQLGQTTVSDPKKTPGTISPSLKLPPAPVLSKQTHTHAESANTLNSGQHYKLPTQYAGTQKQAQNTRTRRDRSVNDPDKSSSPYVRSSEDNQKCVSQKDDMGNTSNIRRPKLLVYWQDHDSFPERPFRDLCRVPTLGPCELSFDLKLHKKADAIVFHASNIRVAKPPFRKRPGQVWIAKGLESPIHWYPDYKKPAWKEAFNWTLTIRPDSELFSPVGILYKNPDAHKIDYRKIAEKKTRSIAWFVSDCPTLSKREDYVKELQKYIDVDIYGECGPLKCSKTHRRSCMEMLTYKYRFYLAFENSMCPYYVTEKFFNKFGLNIIPIVRGGFDYKKYIPDGTYINTADFESPSDLAKYLLKLGNNPNAYAAMLARNDEFQHSNCLQQEPWCKMCNMLHDNTVKPHVYQDLGSWWDETPCLGEKDVKDIP